MKTLPLQRPSAVAPTAPPQGVPVIEVTGLHKSFGSNHVLKGVDLRLSEGENLVVLGKSGSGKSVLIKIIGGLIRPDAGSVRVLGQEITSLKLDELDHLRAHIGFLFQSSALYDSMTVRQNLEFPMRRHRMALTPGQMQSRLQEVLENVGLSHAIDLLPAELSGGMRKRIGIARTLILRPKVILYDEPTAGLDPVTARGISQLIVAVQKRYGSSSLIITHDLACVKTTANRIVVLEGGVCRAEGTYQQLQTSPIPAVKEFFEE
jgi:phospholipid/cholesterol/gamma-HCH transport system ATP-binding protein